MQPWTRDFLELATARQALRFGEFTLKSGRQSPYFFNAGSFSDGESLDRLCRCYAGAIDHCGLDFDMLFGPAYKGIPLAAGIAISLARDYNRNLPFAYDRKETKAHGEGGQLVGAPLAGRVLIVDDVISAGTSIAHSRKIIQAAGATTAGVAIALDRQEVGADGRSAVQAVVEDGLDLVAVASLDDLISWLDGESGVDADVEAMKRYRARYGRQG